LYGGGEFGAVFLRSGVFYSSHAVQTDRTIAFSDFADHARADYRAGTLQAFGEIGWRWKTPLVTAEPYLNLAHVRLTTNAFAERGQDAALRAESQTSGVTFATTGLRGSTDFFIASHRVTASLGAGWRRALDTQAPLAMLALSSAEFSVAGVAIGRDAAVLDAGIAFCPADNATVSLTYNGQVAASASQHALTARLKIGF
jgi:outer membrane autotransporter protein